MRQVLYPARNARERAAKASLHGRELGRVQLLLSFCCPPGDRKLEHAHGVAVEQPSSDSATTAASRPTGSSAGRRYTEPL